MIKDLKGSVHYIFIHFTVLHFGCCSILSLKIVCKLFKDEDFLPFLFWRQQTDVITIDSIIVIMINQFDNNSEILQNKFRSNLLKQSSRLNKLIKISLHGILLILMDFKLQGKYAQKILFLEWRFTCRCVNLLDT